MLFRFISILFTCLFVASNSLKAQHIEFESIFDDHYKQKTVESPNWMNNGKYYSALKYNDALMMKEIRKYSIMDESFQVLVSEKELLEANFDIPISIEDYQFSADESKILIQTEVEAVWRRSRLAHYYVFNLKNRDLRPLTSNDAKISNAEFSPKGDKVAFTRDNNVFIIDLKTGDETVVTSDGKQNEIINGSTDWVYEEEFGFAKAWFWSPDGSKIAFYRFDESDVKEYFYPIWTASNYPEKMSYKYPKAGEANSVVTIGVYDLNLKETQWIDTGEDKDNYIVRANWTNTSARIALRKLNRLQNVQELLMVDLPQDSVEIVKREESKTWIEGNDALHFFGNGSSFLYMSEEDGFNHLYLYSNNGKSVKQLTTGNWEVTQVVGINEKRKEIYYISTEDSPLGRQLYRIDFEGAHKQRLTNGKGTHIIEMSGDQQYYLDYFSSNTEPLRVSLHDIKGKQIRVLEDNQKLRKQLKEKPLAEKSFFSIPNAEGLKLNAYIIRPYNFNPKQKYPVLMYVYGGPGSQTVKDAFETDMRSLWHHYMASKGYIIISVDNRGTGFRGAAFKKVVYKNLGKAEIEDQIAAAKYLQTLPFVDADRIGIWGWSYGGFMSSLAMERGFNTFKAGIAVAPVIDWRYYDTIYTERYMQTPQKNPEGYRNSSPIYEAPQLKGKYLLIHGTADDNVHFQNSIAMANVLQYFDIPFQTMFYPNRNHSIYGGNTSKHLYGLMSRFILENL